MDKEAAEVPGGVESCPEPTPVNPLWEIPDAVEFTAAEVAAAVAAEVAGATGDEPKNMGSADMMKRTIAGSQKIDLD